MNNLPTDPGRHPSWCAPGRCTAAIHHSRDYAVPAFGDAAWTIHLRAAQPVSATVPLLVIEAYLSQRLTEELGLDDAEPSVFWCSPSQARHLRHQLGRLVDATRRGGVQ